VFLLKLAFEAGLRGLDDNAGFGQILNASNHRFFE
jgi:hypothetical protein